MKGISEKVSYMQGLSEGLNVGEKGSSGKIIVGILQVMEEMADLMAAMERDIKNLQDYVEDMEDDILELEENLLASSSSIEKDKVKIECAQCGENLYFEPDILDDDVLEIICPNCDNVVYVNDGSFDYEIYDDEGFSNSSEQVNPSPS